MSAQGKTRFQRTAKGAIEKLDVSTGQWVPSSQQEFTQSRARQPGGVLRPTPAKDISPPTPFQRGRAAVIGGIKKIPGVGGVLGTAAEIVAPETPAGLAIDALLAAGTLIPPLAPVTGPALAARRFKTVGKVAQKLGRLVPGAKGRAAVRVGLPPIVGGATAAATGGDIPRGVGTGAGASFAELLGIPARATARTIKKFTRQKSLKEIDVKDLNSVSAAFGKEVPAFREILTKEGRAGIATLADPDQGRAALSKVFQQSDARIKKSFGSQKISVEKVPIKVGTATQAPISVEGGKLTAGQLLQKIKDLKQSARGLIFGTPERRAMQAEADKFEGVLKAALRSKDLLNRSRGLKGGSLLFGYNEAVKNFRQGLPLLDLAKQAIKTKAIKSTSSGFALDQAKFTFLLEKTPGVTVKKFPNLFAAVSRGAARGAADELEEGTVRALVRGIAAGNIGLPARLTTAGAVERVGTSRAQAPVSASISRLFEALAGNPTGG